jgi:hypothetical protein
MVERLERISQEQGVVPKILALRQGAGHVP